jgi:Ca2+-binding EF-hand superfamily protein
MTFYLKNAVFALLALLSATSDAFMLATPPSQTITSTRAFVQSSNLKSVRLYSKEDDDDEIERLTTKENPNDEDIERLTTMASNFQTESASLVAERTQELAGVAERAFQKFDTDQDGEISLAELKAGLQNSFMIELTDERVQALVAEVDENGDGKLQLEEFVEFILLLLA